MANPSPLHVPDTLQVRSVDSAAVQQDEVSQNQSAVLGLAGTIPSAGPRKLVRPTLPARALGGKIFSRRNDRPLLAHHEAMAVRHIAQESTHAEAFYFQKQVQTQTLMVFILEDGDRIEGYIEWYDRNAIKVKNHSRTLIYKSSIKYLYKASENGSPGFHAT
jgi:sRNA-binding regulator protein Hfq